MPTHIILLRGVMPVGKNKLKMAELRDVLSGSGFGNVRTYIASGNVLVDSDHSYKQIEREIHELIMTKLGPDLVVIARNSQQLTKLLGENPFGPEYDLKRIFFTSFQSPPSRDKVQALEGIDFGEEELRFGKEGAYMYIPGSAARSKLSNNFLEKKLEVGVTTRNFNTISKLIEMAENN